LPPAAPAESPFDETLNEEIRRETHKLLAGVHSMYRMLIKTLRAREEFPAEFASLDSLPIAAVRWLHLHLSTQEAVREIVISSVQSGIAAASQSALQRDLIKRLTSPDTYLATRVARNDGLALSPFEQMFGILSTGHLTEYTATADYVPGLAPDTERLYAAARDLDFGPRGGIVQYNVNFSRVVECLATVDVLDWFFDVKLVYNLVVDAMETFGRRNEVVWDTLLMAELRRRAHFRASAAIPRDALNAVLEPLTAMQAEQNEFERLTTNLGGASIHAAPVRAQAVLVSHGETDSDAVGGINDDFHRDYELLAYRVVSDRPAKLCAKNLHELPQSFGYCG
jgi:hypothetical protein